MSETFICIHCGESHLLEKCFLVDDNEICENCANEETILCSRCGERIWQTSNEGNVDTPLCTSCYESYYTTCEQCGGIVHQDETYYLDDREECLCHGCYSNMAQKQIIHDYSYKPMPIFYGIDNRYFGVELEIDVGGNLPDYAQKILDILNKENILAYAKQDSSLNDGFEIVTHPMTLAYHQNNTPWNAMLSKAASMGYRSHQTTTCGLHIHINRDTFGYSEADQDTCIARILYFVEKHWEKLLIYSRRTQQQLERWAARYGYKEHPREILDQAKYGYGGGRHSCVNLQNQNTIEFRMFRGTLKYNTLIATLQLVNRVCDVAISLSDAEIKTFSWESFVSGFQDGEEIIQYLKERQLYNNEVSFEQEEA